LGQTQRQKTALAKRQSMNITTEERFLRKVNITTQDACWLWNGYKNKDGYGNIKIDNKTIKTHRYSYELSNGKIPEGMCVLHRCDNPGCVNPSHLFLGNHSDNMRDMVKKGRSSHFGGNYKIKEIDILQIKRLYSTKLFTQKHLGRMFGVSNQEISNIVNNKTWCHLGGLL
jgi:hypothetical protein